MDKKLSKMYYSPEGYWKGISPISKLSHSANASENEAKIWLKKQADLFIFLVVIDVASRFKDVGPLISKESREVANAFKKMYTRKLSSPETIIVYPGRELMGTFTTLMNNHQVVIKRSE